MAFEILYFPSCSSFEYLRALYVILTVTMYENYDLYKITSLNFKLG
jgi:hypothetical protein